MGRRREMEAGRASAAPWSGLATEGGEARAGAGRRV